ncbi:hypothetical protein [Mucilaginibacter polytrichastri]|uniref:Uncharacterized protein n=1 Tax=Mucilaginibacter polytrichastri TaxID=1302689 RepID=A0A1Q6A0A9_9SPHI|nr:hypothetical protein [Mucilaginibacter polytrichastri]OKS87450.1 hypothetical protein RG47T_2911 [Mucilaginibacter polytrichastri]SFS90789.1 hypothetical protein SAMN04487890_10646 [Mucilaginibacter polytrichastri]
MAKEIKAIQCPKCGSTQNVEIKPDYFKCLSCDTEYFLDNDDITINHNVNYQQAPQPAPIASPKLASLIIGAILIIFVLFVFLPTLFNKSSKSLSNVLDSSAYRWSDKDCIAYEDGTGMLIIAVMGHREFDNDEHDSRSGNFITFYNALNGKELKSQRLGQFPTKDLDKIKFRMFKNGEVYAIANESILFKVDKSNTQLQEVQPNFFTHHQELEAGIAHIESIGEEYGDGFKLMTNDGKSRFFFPIADSVYTEKAYYAAQNALEIKDARAKVNTYFLFSEHSDDFPDEKIKLMMYTQKDDKGGRNDRPFFQKKEYSDYNGVKHVTDFRQGSDLVISYKDLTPGRLYFAPKVLYGDEKYVLISFNAAAAEKSNTSVQCVSVPDGRIIFTRPFNGEQYFTDEAFRFKNGFVVKKPMSRCL